MSNIVQSLPRPKVIFTGPEGNWLSNLNISYLNAFCGFQGGFIDVSWTWNVNTYTYKISGSLKNSFNSVEKSKSRWHLKKGHFEDTLNIQTLCYSTTCLFRATQNYTLEAEQRFFFFHFLWRNQWLYIEYLWLYSYTEQSYFCLLLPN